MKTISQLLSDETTETLKKVHSPSETGGTPATKQKTPVDNRVDFEKLETVWRRVPVVHNAVNKMTQMIMSKEWFLEGAPDDVIEYYEDFFDQVGTVGPNQDFNDLLETIFRYQIIYGEHYVELVGAEEDDEIVDLAMVDPKKVAYARTDYHNVALDKYGNPIGYVQKLPMGYRLDEQVYEPPEGLNLGLAENNIYLPNERVAHFKLYTYGEGLFPVGLIEPAYASAQRNLELQKDFADNTKSTLFPMRYLLYGDEAHPPMPDAMDDMLQNIQASGNKTEAVLPYYVETGMWEAENPETILDFFDFFDEEVVKALGIPKSIAEGQATRVNRASLQSQIRVWEVAMMDIIKRTCNTIEKQIMEPIARQQGFDEYPNFNFRFEVDPRHQIERATRFRGDVNATETPTGDSGSKFDGVSPDSGMRQMVMEALMNGIDPADLGISPSDIGIDAESWDDIDAEDVEKQGGDGSGE